MASVSDSVPRVATESATLPTVAWLVQPPEGTVAPKRTALSIVHAAFPLAAIRLEKTSRNGQFLLSACGDGVSAICEIAELEKWEFSVAVAGAPFSGVAIAPSASGIAGHGSSGDPTMKAGSGSIVSSTSSSSASAEAASVCSQAAKTRRLQVRMCEQTVLCSCNSLHCHFHACRLRWTHRRLAGLLTHVTRKQRVLQMHVQRRQCVLQMHALLMLV